MKGFLSPRLEKAVSSSCPCPNHSVLLGGFTGLRTHPPSEASLFLKLTFHLCLLTCPPPCLILPFPHSCEHSSPSAAQHPVPPQRHCHPHPHRHPLLLPLPSVCFNSFLISFCPPLSYSTSLLIPSAPLAADPPGKGVAASF